MPVPSKTITYDNLETMTKEYDAKLVSDVELASTLVRIILSRKKVGNWGQRINVPFRFKRSDGTGIQMASLSSGLLDRNTYDTETVTDSYVTPRWQFYGEYIIKQYMDVNDGNAAKIDMLEQKYAYIRDQMQYGLKNATTGFWSDGTTPNSWLGIQYWVADDPTTGTVANINRADTTYQYYIRNQYDSSTTLATVDWGTLYDKVLESAEDGDESRMVDMMITTREIFMEFWKRAHELQRNTIRTGLVADLGLTHINVSGIPIVWDPFCPASHLYGLRVDDWDFKVYPNSNMTVSPWVESEGKRGKYKEMAVGGQLMCNLPRRQFVFSALA